jgi:hypothetical protein
VSTEPTVRGYIIASPLTYLDEAYSDAARSAVRSRLPAETRELLRQVNEVEWYSRVHAVNVYTAIAQYHRENDGNVQEALYTMGKGVATKAVGTFLKLVMRIMTVELFARKVPDIWLRDHRGGRLEVDTSDLANNHIVYRLSDVAGYNYIGGALAGFQAAALTAIGCKDLEYESDWTIENPGPENVTCHFRWK